MEIYCFQAPSYVERTIRWSTPRMAIDDDKSNKNPTIKMKKMTFQSAPTPYPVNITEEQFPTAGTFMGQTKHIIL